MKIQSIKSKKSGMYMTTANAGYFSKKTFLTKLILLAVLSATMFLLVYNDFSYYDVPVGKIVSVQEHKDTQELGVIIKNGKEKGSSVTVKNTYEKSLVYDEKYSKGNFVFLNHDTDTGRYSVTGLKRDYYIVLVFLLLLDVLVLVGSRQGIFTSLGLFINMILFYCTLILYGKGYNIFMLSVIFSILFSFIVLIFINGFNKKTLICIFATFCSVAVICAVSAAAIWLDSSISYEFMDFMPEPFEQTDAMFLFLSEILIGCLGVIMDISVIITSCAEELIDSNPAITRKELLRSAREVSDDITGTMINVVLFTNIAAVIPVFLISMKSGIRMITVLKYHAFFEIARFLTGSIGIVLAIPFSILAALLFWKGANRK